MTKDKDIEKILEKYNKDIKRHMDVLAERFSDRVDLIAEQYDSIRKELASHGAILESHGAILASHREMIGSIKEDVEIIKVDVAFIKGSLKQKVDLEEFIALERRVILLEAKFSKR